MTVCSRHGCPALDWQPCPLGIGPRGGPMAACPRDRGRTRHDQTRPSAAARGYDSKWARNSARFLKRNPWCALCGAPAKVADHHPHTRRQLLAAGDPHPDAWHHLRPLCRPCHSRATALHDGGLGHDVTPITERSIGQHEPIDDSDGGGVAG